MTTHATEAQADKAEAVYQERQHDIAALTGWIELEMEQMDAQAQGHGIHWADVGNLGHVRELMVELLSFISGRDQTSIEESLADAAAGRQQG
jgi:hypothetical protein